MTTTTPDMGLILPDVSVTAGPQWATLLNSAFSTVDSHDHSSGKGVLITPSGMSINSDLTFVQNNATNLRSMRLYNNSSFVPGVNDLTCMYALNNEFYLRDGAGNTIQLTSGGFLDISANISTLTIKDTSFFIENFSDVTKQMRFNVSAIPTGTTRIMSVPDSGADDTFVTQAATQALTNKTLTSPAITSPTGIVKADVGLGNVDNTSDATKNAAVATLSNKSVTGPLIMLADTAVQFNNSANTFSTSLKAGVNTANAAFALPIADGSSGQVVKTDGAGNLSFITALTTSSTLQTTQLQGSITGSAPAAGYIGEILSAFVTTGAVPTSGTYGDPVSLSLTAGIWDVSAIIAINSGGVTVATASSNIGISTTVGNSSTGLSDSLGNISYFIAPTGTVATQTQGVIPKYRVAISSTTTYYLKNRNFYTSTAPTYESAGLVATRVG